ncbi:MAG: MFS transporter [Gammaproteobacteria bacterium]|nr:MFS transporter [Gammaproteobacteria bacterium]MYJ52911.1 MFS transporter [Gammaproteobacteria bacterium]
MSGLQTPQSEAQWPDILSRQRLPIIATLCLAIWLHATNTLLAATTMPSAVRELGGLNLISWTFALYLMGSILAGAASSLLVVRHGLRDTMIRAALVYLAGCIVCATASSMPIVLLGRTLQGLGGGCLVGTVFIAQNRFFPSHQVPKVVAIISAVWMLATFASPMIGGAFSTWGVWRYAFWAFALQAVLLAVIIRILVRPSSSEREKPKSRLPARRLGLLAATILTVSAAGFEFHPLNSPMLVAGGCLCLVLFVFRDVRSVDDRMFPRSMADFRHRIGSGISTTFLLCLSIMSLASYGPLILIELHGMTPFTAGLVIMLESLSWGIMAMLFSGTAPGREPLLIRCGSALVVVGLVACAMAFSRGPIWLIVLAAIVSTGGFGMMWGFIIKRIQAAVPPDEKDRTSSLIPITQQMGFALGAALCGLIANGLGIKADLSGDGLQTVAFWIFAGFIPFALCGNLFAWRFSR